MPLMQSFDGVELHYRIHGNGPVHLLFLHGWGGDGSVWDAVVEHLDPTRHRSLILDLRGHGTSAGSTKGYTWEAWERDVMAVADREQAERFIPVGFSVGGKLACYLAARHPHRIAAQVLIAPVGPGIAPVSREAGLQVCREAADWRRNKSAFRNWFGREAAETVLDRCCQTIAATPQFVLEATAELGLWTSLASTIGRLDAPTLVMVGDHDPVYHAAYQREQLLPFLAQPTVVSLACGHFAPLECPVEVAELISSFCQSRSGG